MSTHAGPFYRLAKLVTARDLQQPLAFTVQKTDIAYDVFTAFNESGESNTFERVILVLDGPTPVGWWWPPDADVDDSDGSIVEDYMDSIPLSMLVSSSTTYYDLADAFISRSHGFLFVMDGLEISGTTSYNELFSRLGQLCLLSLAFCLEVAAEDLCSQNPVFCFKLLSPGRIEYAGNVRERRYGTSTLKLSVREEDKARVLIKCTTFIDKATMIVKGGLISTSLSNAELRSIFQIAEKVRNLCAHGSSECELNDFLRPRFPEFLHGAQNVIETIQVTLTKLDRPWL